MIQKSQLKRIGASYRKVFNQKSAGKYIKKIISVYCIYSYSIIINGFCSDDQ